MCVQSSFVALLIGDFADDKVTAIFCIADESCKFFAQMAKYTTKCSSQRQHRHIASIPLTDTVSGEAPTASCLCRRYTATVLQFS